MLNCLTIYALTKLSSLPRPLKTLLLSLAVSDLGVGLMVQPSYIASLVMEMEHKTENNPAYNITYKFYVFTVNFFGYASLFGVTFLSLDRFLAVYLHLRYQELVTHKRVRNKETRFLCLSQVSETEIYHRIFVPREALRLFKITSASGKKNDLAEKTFSNDKRGEIMNTITSRNCFRLSQFQRKRTYMEHELFV